MNRVQRRPQTYTATAIRPYAIAIGELSLAWNDLHEAFGVLFLHSLTFDVANVRQYIQLGVVWGSIGNDRQKREIVEAAINWIGPQEHQRWSGLAEEIIWAVRQGHVLEQQRNNVLHSPLYQERNPLMVKMLRIQSGEILPATHLWNQRAQKLTAATVKKQKRLLQEIRLYRNSMYILAEYVRQLHDAWQKKRALPERPQMPRLSNRN
jgi:hypothetical protein